HDQVAGAVLLEHGEEVAGEPPFPAMRYGRCRVPADYPGMLGRPWRPGMRPAPSSQASFKARSTACRRCPDPARSPALARAARLLMTRNGLMVRNGHSLLTMRLGYGGTPASP